MRHYLFGNANNLTTAILIKNSSFFTDEITKYYVNPLWQQGINKNNIIAITLEYNSKKSTAAERKEYLNVLLPEITRLNITTLYVADSEYFKTLTKQVKADIHIGYTLKCAIKGYEHLDIILGVNYQAITYNPALRDKLDLSLKTLTTHLTGVYQDPGINIIKYQDYPTTIQDIKLALDSLHQYPTITLDIEGFSLKFYKCGIGTISFAWNEHEGIGFACDYKETEPREIELYDEKDKEYKLCTVYGEQQDNPEVKQLIKEFLINYQGIIAYHNGNFDMKVLIYELWMKDLANYKGMHEGISILGSKFEDTKVIAYLATNNTVKNDLKLKNLAQPFAGNYAQDDEDIKNILRIPLADLLTYNLVDCLSTWYVYNTYLPKMIQDKQLDVYTEVFKPSVTLLLQVELVGMPIDPSKVQEAKKHLTSIVNEHNDYLQNSYVIKEFHYQQLLARVAADNLKLKKKVRVIEDLAHIKFNPNSDDQLQRLIYDHLGYPVIDTTDSGAPAVGAKTLEKLINHSKSKDHTMIFKSLIGLSKANKIVTSFIPAFESAVELPDGTYRLYGSFNLGGTQSGRLSSSSPNLQNIPSGSVYANIIKQCFISCNGWLFCGADFSALEAMVGALLPKDPNKLKIYTDGYDSHCLHAFIYFSSMMPDIENNVVSINSIKKKYKKLRSKSKAPTFAAQYFGTYRTIMNSAGLSEEESKSIISKFASYYKVSIDWINGVLDQAHKDGYIECAFGLRLRTPILAKTPLSKRLNYKAEAERRSAGNAKTQSYGLLNNRAAIEFSRRVAKSPYRYDILICSLIHDAIYILIRDRVEVIEWANTNLVECMQWQEAPELQHDQVKLGAELDIYYPSWANALTLTNNMTQDEIIAKGRTYFHKHASNKYMGKSYAECTI